MLFEPIGFNWQIAIALIPGLAAREVAVGALFPVATTPASQGEWQQLWPLRRGFLFFPQDIKKPPRFVAGAAASSSAG